MTDTDRTRLVFLLDRSGSMQTIKDDVAGGFAAFLDEQRAEEGAVTVDLSRFDSVYETVYRDVPIDQVPPLDLRPRGSTALLDAMGRLITSLDEEIAALTETERPDTVIVAIMTDGRENASREWTRPAIKSLVEQQSHRHGWQFLYMGADQDAVEVGTGLGVKGEHAVTYARGKSREAMAAASGRVRDYRRAKRVDKQAPMFGFTADDREELGRDCPRARFRPRPGPAAGPRHPAPATSSVRGRRTLRARLSRPRRSAPVPAALDRRAPIDQKGR